MSHLDKQFPNWLQLHNAAFAKCEAARLALNHAVYGSEGQAAREKAEADLQAAEDEMAKVLYDAAQVGFFLLRNAVKLHPEQMRDLLLEVLADPIADAVLEGSR